MKKYKIMQQTSHPSGLGGVGKAYKQLLESKHFEDFEFRALIQTEQTKGVSFKVIKRYIKEIREFNPDLIHVRGVMIDGFLGLLAAKLTNRRVVMSVHGLYSDFHEANSLRKKIARYILEPISFRMADAVFTVYEGGMSRECIKKPSKWLWGFVYNPMPEWDCSSKEEIRKETRKSLHIPEDKIVVSCISRITFDKGYAVLKEALKLLSKNWPDNLVVVVVGQGSYREKFINSLQENIDKKHIIMVDATPDVQKYYFVADAFLNPSLHENHSNAILEACAAEIPAIVTDVGGNAETVVDGQTGWVIPSNHPFALMDCLQKVSETQSKDLSAWGKRAKEHAKKTFSKEIVYKKLAECYIDVINHIKK
ncbi:MAG: glycosyltransferase family 4 protein [Oscillospiraceae bacterium]|nr:glycosyltransferase family 4 protein [Oscillospiraceae bacterium]